MDAKEGWACGDDGTIWHSINGGNLGTAAKTNTKAQRRNATSPNRLLRLGGPHRRAQRHDDRRAAENHHRRLEPKTAAAAGNKSARMLLPGPNAVRFFDEKCGVVYGDSTDAFPTGVFVTTNGGETWEAVKGLAVAIVPRCGCPPGDEKYVRRRRVGQTRLMSVQRNPGKGRNDSATYYEGELDPLAGAYRPWRCVQHEHQREGQPWCFAACDGARCSPAATAAKAGVT